MPYAAAHDLLLLIGGVLSLIGGVANLTIGALHFFGISTPLSFLEWPLSLIPFNSLLWYPYMFTPILLGLVGGGSAIAAMGCRPRLYADPEGTGIALVIYGAVSAASCWVVGGVLIYVAGLLPLTTLPRRSVSRHASRGTQRLG